MPSGDERLVLHEKTFLSRIRSTVLFDMGVEGGVQNVRWSEAGQHIAWATQQGVRVYDITNKCSLGLVKWTKSTKSVNHCYPQLFSQICSMIECLI